MIRRHGNASPGSPGFRSQVTPWLAKRLVPSGRERCNYFSIGVELEGSDAAAFVDLQYARLAILVRALRAVLPLREIAAHSDIAPGRKTDPGRDFDWSRLLRALARA